MKYGVQLRNGRDIGLLSIHQTLTYAGLLEGLPTQEMNSRMIARALRQAQETWQGTPYLIQPIEKPIEWKEEKSYPFGTPAALPEVLCLARFHSVAACDPGPGRDYSELSIVWFQSDFALPIDQGVLKELGSIDWERHAVDFEW